MNCNTAGFPVLHYLPEFAQTHVHWVSDTIQPCHPLPPPSLNLIFPCIRVFSKKSVLHISDQSIGASASAPVLLMNIQGWFPLGLTGLISLPSKGLSMKNRKCSQVISWQVIKIILPWIHSCFFFLSEALISKVLSKHFMRKRHFFPSLSGKD